jgi:sulfate transport system permease protein
MVLMPIGSIVHYGFSDGVAGFWREISNPVAVGALRLTLVTAFIATITNAVMGTLTAMAIVRSEFAGRHLLNSLVDVPFAIPTLVTGVMLVVLYGPQTTLGSLLEAKGIRIIFAKPGIVLALLLVTYPFVIRAVQPVLLQLEQEQEEAAFTIGASRWTTFWRIILPEITPAVLTGSLLNFARALGEFGAIVLVAGNIPRQTLTAAVHVYGQVESQNQLGASAVSLLLLALSFSLLLLVDRIQLRREARRA